jgi:DNA-directed RNA polymerase subunit RPC12/RpoP
MSPGPDSIMGVYVVMTAWECNTCDVQGRSTDDAEVACWNCDGQVIVTARPAVRTDDL